MEYLTLQDIPQRHFYSSRRMASPEEMRASERALPVMAASHHLRHSPPLQPGEQRAMGQTDKLPSFKQLMANVTEPSPPCTPARKSASMENSPVSRGPPPTFGEPSWNDSAKRRRIDSASAYSSEALPALPTDSGLAESRRSAVVDPALNAPYSDPRSHHPVGHPQGHHRSSLSFSLHPGSSGPSSHVRHQSTPSYSQEARAPYPYGPSSAGSTPSYPPPSYPATYGDHRSSYYPNPHSDPRSSDPYYRQPPSGHVPQPSSYAPPPPSSYAQQHSSSYAPPPSSTYAPQHPSSYAPQPPSSYAPQLQHSSYDNGYHPQSQSGYNNFHIQQSSMNVDQNVLGARKRRGNLPKEATSILKNWFADHRESPYPTEEEKLKLCSRTNLSINQVSNWFINARRRAPQKEQRDAQVAEMSQ